MFTGKGGVGKSTIVASLATLAARQNKRVLIVEIDTKSAMKQIFDVPHLGFEPLEIKERIWAINIDPKEALEEYIEEHAKIHRLAQLITRNKLLRYFFKTAPAVNELVTINRIYKLEQEKGLVGPRFDLILVDMPATGHALLFLQTPQMIKRLVKRGPLYKVVKKYDALFNDAKRTMLNIVTLPEEMPVTETIEFFDKIKEEYTIPIGYLFVNGVPETVFDGDEEKLVMKLAQLAKSEESNKVDSILDSGLDVLMRQRRFLEQMKRLQKSVKLLTFITPRLRTTKLRFKNISKLADVLTEAAPLAEEA